MYQVSIPYSIFFCFLGSIVASSAVRLSAESRRLRTLSWASLRSGIDSASVAKSWNAYIAKLYRTDWTFIAGIIFRVSCCGSNGRGTGKAVAGGASLFKLGVA